MSVICFISFVPLGLLYKKINTTAMNCTPIIRQQLTIEGAFFLWRLEEGYIQFVKALATLILQEIICLDIEKITL